MATILNYLISMNHEEIYYGSQQQFSEVTV